MQSVTRAELVNFLRSRYGRSQGFLDRVKLIYRPFICPFDQLLNMLPERQRVLDIGCGKGAFLQLVARYRNPSSIAGLDINSCAIEYARESFVSSENYLSIRFETYDGAKLPHWIGEYDYVFLIDVLHHISPTQQRLFLITLFNHMMSGGKLIIKDIDADRPVWCFFNKIHDLLLSGQYPRECSAGKLEFDLDQFGFVVTHIMKERLFVYPHYTIICEKKSGGT
ncbi:MAG: hypothetical protein OJF50_000439 [Nitrospira sp.]|nr:hypothetical protein [Nitrospira sp.]